MDKIEKLSKPNCRRLIKLSKILRLLMVAFAIMLVFQRRYKLMNWMLGNEKIRQWAVATSMNIPFIRNAFIQSAFRS